MEVTDENSKELMTKNLYLTKRKDSENEDRIAFVNI